MKLVIACLALFALVTPGVAASNPKAPSLTDPSWCNRFLSAAHGLDQKSEALLNLTRQLPPVCPSGRRLDAASDLAANVAFQPKTTTSAPININVKVDGKVVGTTQSDPSAGLKGVLTASNAVVATTSAPEQKGSNIKAKIESGAKGLLSKAEAAYCKLQAVVCTPVSVCVGTFKDSLFLTLSPSNKHKRSLF